MVKLATLDSAHPGLYLTDNLINCQHCKFAHLYPLPDSKTVDRYYTGDYFYSGSNPHSPPDWFAKEKAEYEAGLWDAYYSYLAGLLDPNKPVIDIGAGAGWFLDYLNKHGWSQWQLYGIEPSRTARRVSPIGHRLYATTEGVLGWKKKAVAIRGNVILSLVLEHIPDPVRFLEEDVLPHLDPSTGSGRGGRLVVVVPNEFNLAQQWVNRLSVPSKKNWFVSSVHVNYFSGQSLRGLLERCGLKVVSESSTCPVELAIIGGYDYRGDDSRGRRMHLTRLKLEKKFGIKTFFMYRLLYRLFGIGREVVMVAEKL